MLTRTRVVDASWSIAAQGLSSASNFGLQLGLLSSLAPDRFGAIVVALSLYYLAQAFGRAWVGDPLAALTIEFHTRADNTLGRPWAATRWNGRRRSLALGVAASLGVVVVAAFAGSIRFELLALAAALPALLVQDGYRYLFWSRSAPRTVLLVDGLWLVGFLAPLGAVVLGAGREAISGRLILLAWLAGGIASLALARRLAGDPDAAADRSAGGPGSTTSRDDRALQARAGERQLAASGALTRSQALLAVDANGLPTALAAASDTITAAVMRATLLPFAPMASAMTAVRILTLPIIGRATGRRGIRQTATKVMTVHALLVTGIAVAALVLLAAVPDGWIGQAGSLARPWFVYGALIMSCRLLVLPLSDLVAMGAARSRVVPLRLLTGGSEWAATIGGAIVAGVEGAVIGRATMSVASLLIWSTASVVSIDEPIDESIVEPRPVSSS